jgi:hypothetical protein
MLSIGAGTGLLYLLRWFWWRVNAWAEIAAMVSSFGFAVGFHFAARAGLNWPPHVTLVVSVGLTTIVWVATAFLTPATPPATLRRFYELVRPAGPGWRKIRAESGLPASSDNLPNGLLAALFGAVAVWSALFATGSFLYGNPGRSGLLAVLSALTGTGCFRLVWGRRRADAARTGPSQADS